MCWAPAWACTCTVWPICQEAEGDIIIFIEIEGAPALQVSSLPELCKLFVTNTSSRCIHSIFIIADRYNNRDIYEHWHCSDQVRSKSGWPAGFYWNSPTYLQCSSHRQLSIGANSQDETHLTNWRLWPVQCSSGAVSLHFKILAGRRIMINQSLDLGPGNSAHCIFWPDWYKYEPLSVSQSHIYFQKKWYKRKYLNRFISNI